MKETQCETWRAQSPCISVDQTRKLVCLVEGAANVPGHQPNIQVLEQHQKDATSSDCWNLLDRKLLQKLQPPKADDPTTIQDAPIPSTFTKLHQAAEQTVRHAVTVLGLPKRKRSDQF